MGCGNFIGRVVVTASINLSGRGTGDLIMTSDVTNGSDSPASVQYQNWCQGLGIRLGRCGSRFYGESPFTYDPRSYNFAREGEGYFFENAQNYEIRFRWIVDPLDGPEGVVATPRYNSYDFTCPRADGDCFP